MFVAQSCACSYTHPCISFKKRCPAYLVIEPNITNKPVIRYQTFEIRQPLQLNCIEFAMKPILPAYNLHPHLPISNQFARVTVLMENFSKETGTVTLWSKDALSLVEIVVCLKRKYFSTTLVVCKSSSKLADNQYILTDRSCEENDLDLTALDGYDKQFEFFPHCRDFMVSFDLSTLEFCSKKSFFDRDFE